MISHLLLSRIYLLPVSILFLTEDSLASDNMASICSSWNLDNDSENNLDKSTILWERNDCPLIDAAMLCGRDPSCRSFFHHASLEKCLGSQSYKRGLPSSHAMQQGWKYYTQSHHCDEGYIYNQTLGLCYKLHYSYMNYTDAMAVCETERAKLLIIKNLEERQHFRNVVRDDVWIGLRSMDASNTVWKWWNGQAASNIVWYPGYPTSGLKPCGSMCGPWSIGYFNMECSYPFYFVCQRQI